MDKIMRKIICTLLSTAVLLSAGAALADGENGARSSAEMTTATETATTAEATETPVTTSAPESEASAAPSEAPEASAAPSEAPEASAVPSEAPEAAEAKPLTNVFLCMLNGYTDIIKGTDDADGQPTAALSKITVKGTNFDTGKEETFERSPMIENGSTYLPFRYCAEVLGMKDLNGTEGELKPNSFRFSEDNDGIQHIEIADSTGKLTEHIVDTEFKASYDNALEIKIRNVDNSLYFPMRQLAYDLNAEVGYDANTGAIYFATTAGYAYKYAVTAGNDEFYLRENCENLFRYDFYNNPMNYSDIYKDTSGNVHALNDQIPGAVQKYYCVTRIFDNLFFAGGDDGEIYTCKEAKDGAISGITKITSGCKVDSAIAYGGAIYGINATEPGGYIGSIFKYNYLPKPMAEESRFMNIQNADSFYRIALLSAKARDEIGNNKTVNYVVYLDGINSTSIKAVKTNYLSSSPETLIEADEIGGSGINMFAIGDNTIAAINNNNELFVIPYTVENGDIHLSVAGNAVKIDNCDDMISLEIYDGKIYGVQKTENGLFRLMEISFVPGEDGSYYNAIRTSIEYNSIRRLAIIDGDIYAVANGQMMKASLGADGIFVFN